VLGKHSGRHALGLKCAELGHEFDRRGLDEIYRRFVVLADQIKNVDDHHLLQLIREAESQRIPPAHVEPAPLAIAASAVTGHSAGTRPSGVRTYAVAQGGERKTSDLPLHPLPEHHHEEDYLWGV
jgi:hypothetical protein